VTADREALAKTMHNVYGNWDFALELEANSGIPNKHIRTSRHIADVILASGWLAAVKAEAAATALEPTPERIEAMARVISGVVPEDWDALPATRWEPYRAKARAALAAIRSGVQS
jgi:hypothetical protein